MQIFLCVKKDQIGCQFVQNNIIRVWDASCLFMFLILLYLSYVSAGELGEDIRKLILKIYAAFLSHDGKVGTNWPKNSQLQLVALWENF